MTASERPPKNVGIRAMELYFPKHYVEQSDLEKVTLLCARLVSVV